MNQKVNNNKNKNNNNKNNNNKNNNNNSSNSLVFGRWPQTKMFLLKIEDMKKKIDVCFKIIDLESLIFSNAFGYVNWSPV